MISENNKENNNSEWKSLLSIVTLALLIRFFVVELFFVPTGSMKQTILEGDYIFSTKYSYGFSRYSLPFSPPLFKGRILPHAPERGEIVIFRPPHSMDVRYIKRLIGMPGDKIQIINDVVYINDQPISRQKTEVVTSDDGKKYQVYKEILPNGVTYFSSKLVGACSTFTKAYYVPENEYFFLGDNRDESNDSRYDLGFVPFENFIAKARFIFFSTKNILFSLEDGWLSLPKRILPWIESFRINRISNPL